MVFRTLISPPRSNHTLRKPAAAALVALALSAIVVGVSSASNRSAAASSPPATVTATQIPPSPAPTFLQPGKIVSSSKLGVRVFVNGKDGVALNTGQSLTGVTYPGRHCERRQDVANRRARTPHPGG